MPKTFSEHERGIIKESMLKVGAALLRKKSIRQVSVEDITKGANIAKGSFYSFYNSREELFWDIIKLEEKQLLDQITAVAAEDIDTKTKMRKIFYDLLLQDGCIVFHLPQEDSEYVTRKLPSELIQADMDSGQDILGGLLSACNMAVSHESVEILSAMINTLRFIASNEILQSESARKKMLGILVEAFVDHLVGGKETE